MPKLPPSWPNCGWRRAASTTRNVSSPDSRTSRRRRTPALRCTSPEARRRWPSRLSAGGCEASPRSTASGPLCSTCSSRRSWHEGDDRDLVAPLEEVAAIPTVDAALVAAHRHRALGRGLAAARGPFGPRASRSGAVGLRVARHAVRVRTHPSRARRGRRWARHGSCGRRRPGSAAVLRAARRGTRCRHRRGRAAFAWRAITSHGTEGPRTADEARTRDPGAAWRGTSQPRHRCAAVHQPQGPWSTTWRAFSASSVCSGRAEAAGYAVRHLDRSSGPE